jgi:hypothetical protein
VTFIEKTETLLETRKIRTAQIRFRHPTDLALGFVLAIVFEDGSTLHVDARGVEVSDAATNTVSAGPFPVTRDGDVPRKIDMDKIAQGLGAERGGPVRAEGGYFGAISLGQEVGPRPPTMRNFSVAVRVEKSLLLSFDYGGPYVLLPHGHDIEKVVSHTVLIAAVRAAIPEDARDTVMGAFAFGAPGSAKPIVLRQRDTWDPIAELTRLACGFMVVDGDWPFPVPGRVRGCYPPPAADAKDRTAGATDEIVYPVVRSEG